MSLFCNYSRSKRALNSKKYGVDHIHFTHAKNSAIYSSTKMDGKYHLFLFYLCLIINY